MTQVKAGVTVILMFCFVLAANTSVKADSVVGVENGDWVKYAITRVGGETVGPDWLKYEFLNVEGVTATIRFTAGFIGHPEQRITYTVDDLFSEDWDDTWVVIPPDSKIGDGVWYLPDTVAVIEGEETRTYLGANRTVVYANVEVEGGVGIAPSSDKVYWDKQTGVFVGELSHSEYGAGLAEIVEANLWDNEYAKLKRELTDLESDYETLESNYEVLESDYEALSTELNNIRNLMYIFVAATVATATVLVTTTVYFAVRIRRHKQLPSPP